LKNLLEIALNLHIKKADNEIIFKCLMEVRNATLSNWEEGLSTFYISKEHFARNMKILLYLL